MQPDSLEHLLGNLQRWGAEVQAGREREGEREEGCGEGDLFIYFYRKDYVEPY